MTTIPDSWEVTAAVKANPKPKPPRKPEEVWEDVHKHPEGVPGGMGKSPEYHLRNRGWMGHEINEGSGKKTIQYRHHDYPNFVISYGGASGTKPDHNFRIMHMGTNPHVPKVTRAYSLAEAMNKVEELHGLNSGLVVQPMTHGAALQPFPSPEQMAPPAAPKPVKPRDMTKADAYPQFPDRPQGVSEAWNDRHDKQLKEIPDPPPIKPEEPVVIKSTAYFFRLAEQEDWDEEEPPDTTDYYHGTTAEDLDMVDPASRHQMGVVFPHDTDPDYAYASPSERNAWNYAEKAWHASGSGIPRVYRVRATGPVEEDPYYPGGVSRGNFSDDVRSRHPFEVHEEMPMPEHMGDPSDWE